MSWFRQDLLLAYPSCVKDFSRYSYLVWFLNSELSETISNGDWERLNNEMNDLYFRIRSFVIPGVSFERVFNELSLIDNAYYAKLQRVKKRVRAYLEKGCCYFLTLTFNDNTLKRLSADTRHTYVKRFCASLSSDYIANIDFGSLNGREHYHALVVGEDLDFSSWSKYGFYNYQICRDSLGDTARLSRYVAKLSYHAIKNTNKSKNLIYSRSKKNG